MNHIQNFFPGPGAVGAGCCIGDTMLGNEFIGNPCRHTAAGWKDWRLHSG